MHVWQLLQTSHTELHLYGDLAKNETNTVAHIQVIREYWLNHARVMVCYHRVHMSWYSRDVYKISDSSGQVLIALFTLSFSN